MKAFYGSRLSKNMTVTPEGYLVCHNSPIARTGYQEYYGREIGFSDRYNERLQVYRSEEEVFSDAALASFESKPITEEHPGDKVLSDNYSAHLKGVIQNVRRGSAGESDKMMADLVVYDPILISEIQSGKREISCGYSCEYRENEDGKIEQINIRGNHVAIVKNGRAGSQISIKDSDIEKVDHTRGDKKMGKMTKKNILARMFHAFSKDASPEEVEAALDAMEPEVSETKKANDEGENSIETVLSEIRALGDRIAALESAESQEGTNGLDALEQEISVEKESADDEVSEESVTVEADEMAEEVETEKVADSAAIRILIKNIKPAIAQLKDPAERKLVGDSLAAELRKSIPPKTSATKQTKDGYKEIVANRTAQTKDAGTEFKESCDSRNPHKNKGGK